MLAQAGNPKTAVLCYSQPVYLDYISLPVTLLQIVDFPHYLHMRSSHGSQDHSHTDAGLGACWQMFWCSWVQWHLLPHCCSLDRLHYLEHFPEEANHCGWSKTQPIQHHRKDLAALILECEHAILHSMWSGSKPKNNTKRVDNTWT